MDYDLFLRRLGAALRKRRQALDLTQEAIAHELEVHQSNISMLEKGKQGFDSKTFFELGVALQIPLHRILEETEEGEGSMDQRVELLSDDERKVVSFFRMCNSKGRGIILSIAEMAARANPIGKNIKPLIGRLKSVKTASR